MEFQATDSCVNTFCFFSLCFILTFFLGDSNPVRHTKKSCYSYSQVMGELDTSKFLQYRKYHALYNYFTSNILHFNQIQAITVHD